MDRIVICDGWILGNPSQFLLRERVLNLFLCKQKSRKGLEIQKWGSVMRTQLTHAGWILLRKSGTWSGNYLLGLCQERRWDDNCYRASAGPPVYLVSFS